MLTAEEWNVISIIIAIILFISAGLGFAYNGYKKWKQTDRTEESRVRSGKFEFCFGIILFVLAVICVCVLTALVKNNIIVKPTLATELSESKEPSTSDTIERTYVSDQLYHGSTYSGYVNELRQPDGKGTMEYSNGTEYTGDWVNGVRQGQGKMRYDNGVYDGEWQNDQKNGKGTYVWTDGKKYEGAYVDDVRNGEGIFSGWVDLTNGYTGTYYGKSENDQFNGYGSFLFDNGDKFEGVYKENLFWNGTYTQKDGSQYEIVNGTPQL